MTNAERFTPELPRHAGRRMAIVRALGAPAAKVADRDDRFAADAIMLLIEDGVIREGDVDHAVAMKVIADAFAVAGTQCRSIRRLCNMRDDCRRTLSRQLGRAGLPVPSAWLQIARCCRVIRMLHEDPKLSVFTASCRCHYPDGFTMSNQLKRLANVRPTDARLHGWRWTLRAFIAHQQNIGRLPKPTSWSGAPVSVLVGYEVTEAGREAIRQ